MRLTNHDLNRNTEAAVAIRKALKDLLPVPVLAESDRGGANPQDDQIETSGHEAGESTDNVGENRRPPGGQQPPCDINHVFADIRRRFLK